MALWLHAESRGRARLGIGRGVDFVHEIPSSSGVAREVAATSFVTLGRDLLPALSRSSR